VGALGAWRDMRISRAGAQLSIIVGDGTTPPRQVLALSSLANSGLSRAAIEWASTVLRRLVAAQNPAHKTGGTASGPWRTRRRAAVRHRQRGKDRHELQRSWGNSLSGAGGPLVVRMHPPLHCLGDQNESELEYEVFHHGNHQSGHIVMQRSRKW